MSHPAKIFVRISDGAYFAACEVSRNEHEVVVEYPHLIAARKDGLGHSFEPIPLVHTEMKLNRAGIFAEIPMPPTVAAQYAQVVETRRAGLQGVDKP